MIFTIWFSTEAKGEEKTGAKFETSYKRGEWEIDDNDDQRQWEGDQKESNDEAKSVDGRQ